MRSETWWRFHFRGKKYPKMCLKINWSVKTPSRRPSMGVARSTLWAPVEDNSLQSLQCYNHGQKSWDTFAFLGCFSIHTGPTPPLTPQTMLDACIQNFFRDSTLYRVGEGELQENLENDAVLRGSREMTGKYAYCSTVPRTFVQDCSTGEGIVILRGHQKISQRRLII